MPRIVDGVNAAVAHLKETYPAHEADPVADELLKALEQYAKGLPWEPPQTPYVAVDCVILTKNLENIALIQRKFPPLGLALPGGFVDPGETLAHAAAREVKEEVGIDVELESSNGQPLFLEDSPNRDPRRHVITGVFMAVVPDDTQLVAGDDAAHAQWYPVKGLSKREWALGHGTLVWQACRAHNKPGVRALTAIL